jgi:hypothetical protein
LDKLRAILDAASALFLKRGIAATPWNRSLNAPSKMTVYEQLVVSWLGLSQLRQNPGVAAPPSTIARRVRYATDTMLRAWSSAIGLRNRPAVDAALREVSIVAGRGRG